MPRDFVICLRWNRHQTANVTRSRSCHFHLTKFSLLIPLISTDLYYKIPICLPEMFSIFYYFSAVSFILLRYTKFSSIKVYRIRHVRNTGVHLPVCWLLLWRNVPQFVACSHIYAHIHGYMPQRVSVCVESCWCVLCANNSCHQMFCFSSDLLLLLFDWLSCC